jgi:hypothetical protein
MDIPSLLKEVAERVKGDFSHVEDKLNGPSGTRIHYSIYTIKCEYKSQQIIIENQFGYQDLGTFTCALPLVAHMDEFRIETMSARRQLFNPKKLAIKINASDPGFEKHIRSLDSFNELSQRATRQQFEPLVKGYLKDDVFILWCGYHLIFKHQEKVIEPLLRFFYDLIDYYLSEGSDEHELKK